MKKYLIGLFAFVLAFTSAAYADFYTWQDDEGNTHITDYPPPRNKKSQGLKVYKSAGNESSDPQTTGRTGKAVKASSIILFTKNECPDCDKAREFLITQKLAFTEYNMDTDKNAAALRKEFDDTSDVPFAVINRAQVYGFSEAVYKRALKSEP
jgi:glutaredoxin